MVSITLLFKKHSYRPYNFKIASLVLSTYCMYISKWAEHRLCLAPARKITILQLSVLLIHVLVSINDYERDIDDQGLFCRRQLAKIRIVRGICLYLWFFGQSATIKLNHVFMVAEWWVTVDFNSQNKIIRGETRAHGEPIHEKTKFKTRICIIITTPYIHT